MIQDISDQTVGDWRADFVKMRTGDGPFICGVRRPLDGGIGCPAEAIPVAEMPTFIAKAKLSGVEHYAVPATDEAHLSLLRIAQLLPPEEAQGGVLRELAENGPAHV